jgi:hypothetical protein
MLHRGRYTYYTRRYCNSTYTVTDPGPLPSVRLVAMRTRPSQLRVVPGTVIVVIVLASRRNIPLTSGTCHVSHVFLSSKTGTTIRSVANTVHAGTGHAGPLCLFQSVRRSTETWLLAGLATRRLMQMWFPCSPVLRHDGSSLCLSRVSPKKPDKGYTVGRAARSVFPECQRQLHPPPSANVSTRPCKLTGSPGTFY